LDHFAEEVVHVEVHVHLPERRFVLLVLLYQLGLVPLLLHHLLRLLCTHHFDAVQLPLQLFQEGGVLERVFEVDFEDWRADVREEGGMVLQDFLCEVGLTSLVNMIWNL
jgi:hypothetical protein